MIVVPIRTGRGQNDRMHWRARHRVWKKEGEAAGWVLAGAVKPSLPCIVKLTRVAPSSGLDDDNLRGSMKAIRDAVARWLGVDDKDTETVLYRYAQRRGAQKEWAVEIEFQPRTQGWA